MTTVKRYQPVLFFSGGTPEEEDTLESRFPYPGLIGKKGMWQASGYSVAEIAALGKAPGDVEIQLVRVDSASPVIPTQYMVAWWVDEGNAKVSTEADNAGRVAGVFMSDLAAVVGGDKVTYIAKDGLYPTLIVASPTAAPSALGVAVVPSATDGKADTVTAAAMTYVFGRSAGTQVNDATSRLDDTALVSLKIVD